MWHNIAFLVVVAQLVELQFVVLAVAGSSPVGHPKWQVGDIVSSPTLLRLRLGGAMRL